MMARKNKPASQRSLKRNPTTPLTDEQDMQNIRNRLFLLKNKRSVGIKQNRIKLEPLNNQHAMKKENIVPIAQVPVEIKLVDKKQFKSKIPRINPIKRNNPAITKSQVL